MTREWREVDREVVRGGKSCATGLRPRRDFLVEVALRRGCGEMGSCAALQARLCTAVTTVR